MFLLKFWRTPSSFFREKPNTAKPPGMVTEAQIASLLSIAHSKELSKENLLQIAASQGIAYHVAELTSLTYEQASNLIAALRRRPKP